MTSREQQRLGFAYCGVKELADIERPRKDRIGKRGGRAREWVQGTSAMTGQVAEMVRRTWE